MKNFIIQVGSVLAIASLSLMSLSCGDKEKKGAGADPDKGGAGTKEGGAKKVDLEAQMVGYWAPNAERMAALLQKEAADDPAAAAFIPMATAMLASMAVEVKKGEVTFYMMGEPNQSTYKVTSTDAATKTLTMDVTDEDGTKEGSATIDGDSLTLARQEEGPGKTIILDRITKADFDKRLAATPPASPFGGVPGGTAIPAIPDPEPVDSDPAPEPIDSDPAPEPIDSDPAPEPIDSDPAPEPE